MSELDLGLDCGESSCIGSVGGWFEEGGDKKELHISFCHWARKNQSWLKLKTRYCVRRSWTGDWLRTRQEVLQQRRREEGCHGVQPVSDVSGKSCFGTVVEGKQLSALSFMSKLTLFFSTSIVFIVFFFLLLLFFFFIFSRLCNISAAGFLKRHSVSKLTLQDSSAFTVCHSALRLKAPSREPCILPACLPACPLACLRSSWKCNRKSKAGDWLLSISTSDMRIVTWPCWMVPALC